MQVSKNVQILTKSKTNPQKIVKVYKDDKTGSKTNRNPNPKENVKVSRDVQTKSKTVVLQYCNMELRQ